MTHKLKLPHQEESKDWTDKSRNELKKMEPGTCHDLGTGGGGHLCDE